MENNIVYSSRIRFARNAEGVPFPSRLDDERAFSVIMKAAEMSAKKLFKFKFYQMGQLQEIDRLALVERHLISRDLTENLKAGAVIINEDESISVMINEEDHYRIQCIEKGFDLARAHQNAVTFDNELSANIKLGYDSQLGYLTACPTNLGTAMRASVMLFLPALTVAGSMASIINTVQKIGLTVRGVYGEGSNAEGYMYQISNQISLGMSEEDIIERVISTVQMLVKAEECAREKLKRANGVRLTDKIWRAYGVLTNAYMMDSGEFIGLIAEVKLGAAMGLIDVDMATLDELIVLMQPANLIKSAGRDLAPLERDKYRAEYIKKKLVKIKE